MLKDKEAEVIDRVLKTMDDLYYENLRYKPYVFHNLIILNKSFDLLITTECSIFPKFELLM